MSRLQPVNKESANPATTNQLATVEKKMGTIPNIIATMAQSQALANAYLGFSQALAGGVI